MNNPFLNIGARLDKIAEEIPDTPALLVPRENACRKTSFMELHKEANRLASGLSRLGLARGHRVLLMVPPGAEFIALTFALFRIGAIPILIDPGLGRDNILSCIRLTEPEAMIAIPKAHLARIIFPNFFAKTRIFITVGRSWFWSGETLDAVRKKGVDQYESVKTAPDDPAAILFTSGSTGPPKGVLYSHAMFAHQVEILQTLYDFKKGEIDLPTFPLFALFSVALGMTCVIPDMDSSHPALVNPQNIVDAVTLYGAVNSFGSPALWDTVSQYCLERQIRLPSLKKILMAGAPIPGSLLKRFDSILEPGSEIYTPYGATEALPVSSISRSEVLLETWEQTEQGKGVCVGKPVPGMTVKIINITDAPILVWNGKLEVSEGKIGEIVVRAPWVTRQYFRLDNAISKAKIRDGDTFWHRMGDVGYLDGQNRLWFCGRKDHRVIGATQTFFTIPCEAVFNKHPYVKRSALVGIGPRPARQPVIIIEPQKDKCPRTPSERKQLAEELLNLGAASHLTQEIKEVLFHPAFPVDVRHNAKIFREKLAVWAEEQLKKR